MGTLTDPGTTKMGAAKIAADKTAAEAAKKKKWWVPRMITTETYMPNLREFAKIDPTIDIAKLNKLEALSKTIVVAGSAAIVGGAIAGAGGVGTGTIDKVVSTVTSTLTDLGVMEPPPVTTTTGPDVEPLPDTNILLYAGMGLVALLLIPMLFRKKRHYKR